MSNAAFAYILFFIVIAYFVPTIFALANRHRYALPIFVFNCIFGWNLVLWLIVLGVSFYKPIASPQPKPQGPPRLPRRQWYEEPVNERPASAQESGLCE